MGNNIQLFEDKRIRMAWDEDREEWLLSIVDVIAVLTESPNPQTYWRVMKKRLKDEGNETVTSCNALKMKATDGKMRLTDVKELTDEWHDRGVEQGKEYAILTNEITRAWSGMTTKQYKNLKGLKKAKFIKEGSFDETDGIPVIKVTGNIDLAEEVLVPEGNPDDTHPYIQKRLAEKLNISSQDVYALVWYYKMKEARKYHLEITVSSTGKTHKFSEFAFQFLDEKLRELKNNPVEFDEIRKAYRNRNK